MAFAGAARRREGAAAAMPAWKRRCSRVPWRSRRRSSPQVELNSNGLAWLSAAPRVVRVGHPLELSPLLDARTGEAWGRFFRQRRYVEEGFGATANLFVERRVFHDVGGFDERLRSGGDYEFGQRCSLAGIPIRYADDVVVSHAARSTLRELLSKSERVGFGTGQLIRRRGISRERPAARITDRFALAGQRGTERQVPVGSWPAAVLRKGRASSRSVCHNRRWTQRLLVSRPDGIHRSTRSSEERFRMTVPSYSLIIETANLSLADLDGLRETLDSLAVQTLPVQNACEVLLADSGDVPPDSLQQTLRTYPWVRPMGLPEGTGYEELKMAGANASSGELIVFADGDCLYERTWLEALLAPFSDPSVSIVGGETAINSAGPYGLAVAIASSFPARARSDNPYQSDRYHLNNVAFRRRVLQDVPIPSRQPCYRMSGAACGSAAGQGLHDPASTLRRCGACRAKRSHTLRVALPAHGIRRCGRPALDRKGVEARRQIPGSAPSNIRFDPILGSAGHFESRGRASQQSVAFAGTAPRAACLCVRSCAAGDRRARRARRAAAVPRRSARRNPPGQHVRTPAGAHRGPFAFGEGRLVPRIQLPPDYYW